MKLFLHIWRDVKKGKNIDVYVTLILAITLAVLGLSGVVLSKQITSVTLVVLALIAFAAMGITHRLITIESLLRFKDQERLQRRWPEVIKLWDEASDVWIIGSTQSRTIDGHYVRLEKTLKRRGRIRVLLRDPDGESYKLVPFEKYHPVQSDEVKAKIFHSINRLRKLRKLAPDRCEVRILDHPLPFNLYALDVEKAGGGIFVEYQTIKMIVRLLLN